MGPDLLQCPTKNFKETSLITHYIPKSLCQERQKGLFHKCFKCIYRQKPEKEVLFLAK